MANIIKVESSKLISTATAFQNTGNTVRNLTAEMTQLVVGLTGGVWNGEEAEAYVNKFRGLQDDIEKMNKMISEHVSDLNEIAREYDTASNKTISEINTLSSDVII